MCASGPPPSHLEVPTAFAKTHEGRCVTRFSGEEGRPLMQVACLLYSESETRQDDESAPLSDNAENRLL